VPGALDGARGLVTAGGRPQRQPKLSSRVARVRHDARGAVRHAA
jgi:hypothetical protein